MTVADRLLVDRLQLVLMPGDWLAVLGKNGAGKTTALMALAGLARTREGSVQIGPGTSDQALAQRITLVTQAQDDAFGNTVFDNVLLGRYPHLAPGKRPEPSDYQLANSILRSLDLEHLRQRDVRSLSGGERQRVAIAQALVQTTKVLLLDEPTSQLDPAHARAALDVLAGHCRQGLTIVSALHDVNVAAARASHILMLQGDGRWQIGETTDMLTTANLTRLYGVPVIEVDKQGKRYFIIER